MHVYSGCQGVLLFIRGWKFIQVYNNTQAKF